MRIEPFLLGLGPGRQGFSSPRCPHPPSPGLLPLPSHQPQKRAISCLSFPQEHFHYHGYHFYGFPFLQLSISPQINCVCGGGVFSLRRGLNFGPSIKSSLPTLKASPSSTSCCSLLPWLCKYDSAQAPQTAWQQFFL